MASAVVGVVGAGQMGTGIAHVFATSGFEVRMFDQRTSALEQSKDAIERRLAKECDKGRISVEGKQSAIGRVRLANSIANLSEAECIVEAVSENESVKIKVLQELSAVCGKDTILASNTSSISITRLGSFVARPDRVVGVHFMNPVPVMELVEIIEGVNTSEDVSRTAKELVEKIGKTPVVIGDSPGFGVNRILIPMINEACFAVYEGVGSVEDMDRLMTLGAKHPVGPLALADLIGIDTCVSIMDVLYEGYGDPKYRVCPLLRRMVDAGRLGRKSGVGFYSYE